MYIKYNTHLQNILIKTWKAQTQLSGDLFILAQQLYK